MKGDMPKAVVNSLKADSIFQSKSRNVLETDCQCDDSFLERSPLLYIVYVERRYRFDKPG